jgi:hypothetical protein
VGRAKIKKQDEVLNALDKRKARTVTPSTNNTSPQSPVALAEKRWWQFWKNK